MTEARSRGLSSLSRHGEREPWRARGAYDVTVKQIDCVCGYVVKGEDDDELWQQAQEHLRADHPDLVGKVSREDILAQAEEI
jgi:predicted small metal-binding protein